MHRYIQARLKSDFVQEFAQDLEGSKPLDPRPPASPAAESNYEPAQQLSFVFAMRGSEHNLSRR